MKNKKPFTISASGVETFLTCPLKWKYIYVDKMERPKPNIYMSFGGAIHKALETNYKQKIDTKIDMPTISVVRVFKDALLKESKVVEYPNLETLNILLLKGEELLNLYMKDYAPNITPKEVEREFIIELPNTKAQGNLQNPVVIHGFMDLVTEDDVIHDYKNSGEVDLTKKWTQNYVDSMFQLHMYSLAFRKMHDKPESHIQIDVFGRTSKGPKILEIKTIRNDLHLIGFVQLLTRIMQIYESGYYFPNLHSCDTCYFKNKCNKTCF